MANYRCTAVLCTATQPSLETYFSQIGEGLKVREICPDTQGLYEFFRRVTYRFMDVDSLESLAAQLKEHEQVLCVTNSKKDARDLYQMMAGDGCYHLSTFMYPAHRRRVLAIIRQRLKDGLPCRVISTSLIQAGVDVDFLLFIVKLPAWIVLSRQAAAAIGKGNSGPKTVPYIFMICISL